MRRIVVPCCVSVVSGVSVSSGSNAPIFSSTGFYKQLATGVHSVGQKISDGLSASSSDGPKIMKRLAASADASPAARRRKSRRRKKTSNPAEDRAPDTLSKTSDEHERHEDVHEAPLAALNIQQSVEDDTSTTTAAGDDPLVDGDINFVHHRAEEWWHYLLIWGAMAICLVCAAIFSGLTIGLLGLDVISLEIIAEGSHDQHKRHLAKKILPIRRKGNLLLGTLVLGNVLCNVVLSVLIADVADGLIGAIISTAIIFVLAEIGPQAVCHLYALPIGARLTWFTWGAMILFYIIIKPIAMFMDWLIGEDIGTIHTRKELIHMLAMYIEKGALDQMTADLMTGALKNRDKPVHEVMTPMHKVYALATNRRLDFETITEIFRSGKSRIPVYRGDNKEEIIGLLLTKDLIFNDPEDAVSVKDFVRIFGRGFLTFRTSQSVGETFKRFKQSKTHLAMVVTDDADDLEQESKIVGLVTLEDIIEEFINDEILDEMDDLEELLEGEAKRGHMDDQERIALGLPAERKFNYDRLKLLDPNAGTQPLTQHEIDIVVLNLSARVTFQKFALPDGSRMGDATIRWMLQQAEVVKQSRATQLGSAHILDQDYLFRKGVPSDRCIVILGGKMIVMSGRSQFRLEAGTFSVLGAEIFGSIGADPENHDRTTFNPDFSATLGTPDVRFQLHMFIQLDFLNDSLDSFHTQFDKKMQVRYVILPYKLFQRALLGEAPSPNVSQEPASEHSYVPENQAVTLHTGGLLNRVPTAALQSQAHSVPLPLKRTAFQRLMDKSKQKDQYQSSDEIQSRDVSSASSRQ